MRRAKDSEAARCLMTIPRAEPLIATALVALTSPHAMFRPRRDLAAWLDLTSQQHFTGDKQRLVVATRMGERSLRRG